MEPRVASSVFSRGHVQNILSCAIRSRWMGFFVRRENTLGDVRRQGHGRHRATPAWQ